MPIGVAVINPQRFLRRAALLPRACSEPGASLIIAGGHLRLAIRSPGLLIVLVEPVHALPGFDCPDDWRVVLPCGDAFIALNHLNSEVRPRSMHREQLIMLMDSFSVVLRQGITFHSVRIQSGVEFPDYEHAIMSALSSPHLATDGRFNRQHIELLGRLLDGPPTLRTPLTGLKQDTAGLELPIHATVERELLDRWKERLGKAPGIFIDQNLFVRFDQDPNGITPPPGETWDGETEESP